MTRVIALTGVLLNLPRRTAAAFSPPDGIPAWAEQATVTGHVDGNTFTVTLANKAEIVVLVTADAPAAGECFFAEAGRRLATFLPVDAEVYLERDHDDRDATGRLLRYAWNLDSDGHARLVDERMIANGAAIFTPDGTNTRHDARLQKAERAAQTKQRGMWAAGSCGGGHVPAKPDPHYGRADTPAPVGLTVTTDGQEITVSDPFFTGAIGYATPKGGYLFLVFTARITNVDPAGTVHGYANWRFAAKDLETGADFNDAFAPVDRPLGSGELSPGEYVYGQVVLEIQETSRRIRVKYDPKTFDSGDEVYWLVDR